MYSLTHSCTACHEFLSCLSQEPVSESVMNCAMNNKEGIYRRRKKYTQFNPFTAQMEKFLAAQEKIVYNAIQRRVAKENAKVIPVYNHTLSSKHEMIMPLKSA